MNERDRAEKAAVDELNGENELVSADVFARVLAAGLQRAEVPRQPERRSSEMCRCGHVRDGHMFARRARYWGACMRHVSLRRGSPRCDCRYFTPA